MTTKQRKFRQDLDTLEETGLLAGRRYPLYVYNELFRYFRTSEDFTTICEDVMKILAGYGFKVTTKGIGWKIA